MDTDTSKRQAWEEKAAKKYGIDRGRNRDFFQQVWETRGTSQSFEDFDSCVETAWPFYVRGTEQAAPTENGNTFSGDGYERSHEDGQPPGTVANLDERTEARIAAFSEYLAKIAACNKRVMHLRERICGGVTRTISREEALRYLEAHSVKEGKVIIGAPDTLPWPDGSISGRHFRVEEDSILGLLKDTAAYLKRHYPWSIDQAANFILCGVIPHAGIILGGRKKTADAGVAAHKFNRTTIKLEVDSWVPADEVRKAYLRMRHRAHSDDSSNLSSLQDLRIYQHPSPRNLDVFRFVVAESEIQVINAKERLGRLAIPSWRDLMKRWNNSLPADDPRRYSNYKNFSRDFKRAQRAVTGTDHGLPGIPGQPMSVAEAKKRGEAFRAFLNNRD